MIVCLPLFFLLSASATASPPPPRPFPPTPAAAWAPVSGNWSVPVLTADNATWEHSAVQEPQVIAHGGGLRMWYRGAGWGFPSGVGVADSFDGGKTWHKYAGNPVWVGANALANDCAGQPWVYHDVTAALWYLFTTSNANSVGRTCVATSKDGLHWTNASASAASVIPLPPGSGTKLFGNRCVWRSNNDGTSTTWHALQEAMVQGIWQIYLYKSTTSAVAGWEVQNSGLPLKQLQRHAGSMYGGVHIATVDGVFSPTNPNSGLYEIWYHAGAAGNLPTDIYHAQSKDLLEWEVTPATPVLKHMGGGSFSYDQVADPSPLTMGTRAFMAYDGDNNGCTNCSHAAIGMGVADGQWLHAGSTSMQ